MDNSFTDGVIKSDVVYDKTDDVLYHQRTQPTADLIYERNSNLRKNAGAINDFGKGSDGGVWGRQVASIPMIDFEWMQRNGYNPNNSDDIFRFLQTERGRKCLVRDDPIISGRRTVLDVPKKNA